MINSEEKINGHRNRLAKGGYSKAGEEIWSGQPIRRGFESAVSFVAKSNEAAVSEEAASSGFYKFQEVSNPEKK